MATGVLLAQPLASGGAQLVAKHAVAGGHGSPADDMDATFSPLSSSTITIVSLSSSLALVAADGDGGKAPQAHTGAGGAHSLATGGDVFDSDGEDASDLDAGCNTDSSCTTAGGLALSGADVARPGSAVDDATAAAAAAPAHKTPRATSLDVPRTHSLLRILHMGPAAAAAAEAVKGSSGPESGEAKVTTAKAPPRSVGVFDAPRQPAANVRYSVDSVAAAAPAHTRRSLARRILRPLSWRAPSAIPAAPPAAHARQQEQPIVGAPAPSSGADSHGDQPADGSGCSSTASSDTCHATASSAAAAASRSLELKRTAPRLTRATGDSKKAESAVGPVRFQALSRPLGARLGLASVLAERRRQAGDLRFVLAPHPLLPEVVEVHDCDEMAPVYRKVSRSAKSWHETFHEVDVDNDELAAYFAAGMAAASPMALPGPTRALAHTHSEATSCVSLGSSLLAMPGTVQMGRASTSAAHTLVPGRRGMAVSMYGSIGGAPVDGGMLWEARTPFPNQFPLHVKDTRKLIDTVSMASMVLDRHDFCYRFQLGHCRMRWVARRARRHQLALHCFVRSTLVAEIFVDYEKGYSPNSLHAAAAAAHHAPVYSSSSASSSGTSTPLAAPAAAPAPALDAPLPEDGSLPVLTILGALFDQLAGVDADVAESFVVFTGMQALECLHI